MEDESGPQSMALLFNRGTLDPRYCNSCRICTYGSTATAVKDIAALATDNKFVMTSRPSRKPSLFPVSPRMLPKQVQGEAQNVFSFDVERIVAQGLVAKDAALKEKPRMEEERLILTDLTYTAINGAAKTYLFRNHAGERTITVGPTGFTKGFASAIDGYTDFETAKEPEGSAKRI